MKKGDWAILILILVTFLIGFYYYPQLPDQMPMHWNVYGEVDSYGDKSYATFLLPGINLLMFVLFILLPKIDPRRENYAKFKGAYNVFRYAFHVFFALLFFLTLKNSLIPADELPFYYEIGFIVPISISILYIILGNYLGKIQDNFFVGIKTPWTLSSKTVWYKTHRLASKLFVLSGVIGAIGSFFGGVISFVMLIVPISISSIYLIIYSYLEFMKEKKGL